ncbi:hypothetical protein FS837_009515, partial [Tulasnella sp. UAMH 9824]
MPLLQTVKLVSRRTTAALNLNLKTSPGTPFEIHTEALRHVDLHGGPATWGWAHFRGLRVWRMKELYGDGLTTQHILGVLRESPLLEVLEMERLNVHILPGESMPTPISLRRLTRIIFAWCKGDFVNHILRQIQASPELIEEFLIAVRDWRFLEPIGILTDALSTSWSSVLQNAHRTRRGSRFNLSDPRILLWTAKGSGKNFYFSFFWVGAVAGVRWMMDVLSQGDEPRPGVEIGCLGNILQDAEAIETLGSIKNIAIVEARADRNEKSLQILFQALSNRSTPGFPRLTNLKLQDWSWGTESIVKMLQARFQDNGT